MCIFLPEVCDEGGRQTVSGYPHFSRLASELGPLKIRQREPAGFDFVHIALAALSDKCLARINKMASGRSGTKGAGHFSTR